MTIRIEGDVAHKLIAQMKPYRKTVPIKAVQMVDDFIVIQNGLDAEITGEINAIRGSWLAMGPNGILYPIAYESFMAQYEPMEESGESPV